MKTLKILPFFLVFLLTLSGCGQKKGDDSQDGTNTDGVETTSVEERDDYDKWCDTWSQPGHLYLHYQRLEDGQPVTFKAYEDYAIWIWPNAPHDLEGTLWAASNEKVQGIFHAMSTSWMTDIGGTGKSIDQSGAVCDIDLNKDGLVGGRSGHDVSFADATRVGFLIVRQDSMCGNSHWTSDGGAETYIRDFDKHLKEKGYLHIFCVQGSVADFTFSLKGADAIEPNPVLEDTTGEYRSKTDVDHKKKFSIPRTSKAFKGLGVGYQIFIASFADSNGDGMGDLRGIIDKLDYLDELGVKVLWLTPVQESGSYHGYDAVDYYQVDEKFGSLDDYRELIYKAHERGMKVLMDLVLNHTAKNNVWFKLSQKAMVTKDKEGKDFRWRDIYRWKYKGDKVDLYQDGTWIQVNVEEHPDWYRDGESNYYYYGKFGSNMAEINYDAQAARDLIKELALYWLGFGLDGFRLDAVKHIYMRDEITDPGNDQIILDVGKRTYYDDEMMAEVTKDFDYSSDITRNVSFWQEFAGALKSIYPDCFLVGENFDGYGARIAPYYQALDSQFDFSLYFHDLEILYDVKKLGAKANSLGSFQQNEVYDNMTGSGSSGISVNGAVAYQLPQGKRPDFINGAFTSNHDVPRAINKVNHKEVAPDGKSVEVKITGTPEEIGRAKVHAASTLLSPGLSWIYYGDELGMSGNVDAHIGTYKNENNMDIWYRQPMKWGDGKITPSYSFNGYQVEFDSYNKDTLKSAADQAKDDTSMLSFYKALCKIKNAYGSDMRYEGGNFNDNPNVFTFKVIASNGTFNVYINSGRDASAGAARIPINGATEVFALNGATKDGTLPSYGVLVVKS